MFDIGFSEIVVIGVVALVVIGPERLPRTARTLGHLFGRLQRYVNEVKSDISREMELDELRRLRKEVQGAATELQESVTRMASDVESGVRGVERELNDAGRAALDAAPGGEAAGATVPAGTAAAAGASTPAGEHGTQAAAGRSEPELAPPPPDHRQTSLPGFDRI